MIGTAYTSSESANEGRLTGHSTASTFALTHEGNMATTKLTKKQKGFVKDYVKSGNGTQAALKNYDVANEHTAAVIASENLTKPEIVKSIQEVLGDDLLSQRHLELLNKRETYTYHTTRKTETGEEVEFHKVDLGPETQAVSKGLDMAYKIKGIYAPEKTPPVQFNVIGDVNILELATKAAELLKEKKV